jgi:hypothetical protein
LAGLTIQFKLIFAHQRAPRPAVDGALHAGNFLVPGLRVFVAQAMGAGQPGLLYLTFVDAEVLNIASIRRNKASIFASNSRRTSASGKTAIVSRLPARVAGTSMTASEVAPIIETVGNS